MTTIETTYGKIEINPIAGTDITRPKSDDIDDVLEWEHETRVSGRDKQTNGLGQEINKFHAHVLARLVREDGSTVARGVGYNVEDAVKDILVSRAKAEAESLPWEIKTIEA